MPLITGSSIVDVRGSRALAGLVRLLPHGVALILLMLLVVPGSRLRIDLPTHSDKLLHLGFFLVWAGLWRGLDPPRRAAVATIAVGTMAAGTELVQLWWIPGRHGSWSDLVADLVGAGIGWWIGGLCCCRPTNPVKI